MNKKTIMKRNKDRAFGIRRLAGKYLELDSFGPDTGYRISPLISREDDQLTEGYGFYIDFYHGKWSEGSMDSSVCVSVGRDLSGADMVCMQSKDTVYVQYEYLICRGKDVLKYILTLPEASTLDARQILDEMVQSTTFREAETEMDYISDF